MTEPTPKPTPETGPEACPHCAAHQADPPDEHAADCPSREKPTRRARTRRARRRTAAECVTLRLPEGSLERLDAIADRQDVFPSEWLRKAVISAMSRAEAGASRKKGGAA